jgi:hypothetical protein
MKQTDSALNLANKRTRSCEPLEETNRVVPRASLIELVAAHAPESERGPPTFPAQTMLPFHFMQQGFTLSDPAMEGGGFKSASRHRG